MGLFTKYSIITFGFQIIHGAVVLATDIITARYLGPHGKGLLALSLLIPLLSVTFGKMGIGHAVNFYADKVSPTKLIVNSVVLSLIFGLLLVFVSLPVIFLLKDSFFKEIDNKVIFVLCLIIPLHLFYDCSISIMQSLYKITKRNVLINVHTVMFLFIISVLFSVFQIDMWNVILAWISSLVFGVAVAILLILREIKISELNLAPLFMKQLLIFGIKSHIGNVFKQLSYRGDMLLLSYFLNPVSVGYYAVAVTIAEVIWKFPDAICSVLLPRLSKMSKDDARLFTPMVCRITLIIVIFTSLIILIFSKDIVIFVFGRDFLPSSTTVTILLPGIVFLTVWKIIANDLIAQGYPEKYSLTSGISLFITLILDLWLIPKFGINGAAFASTFSYIVSTVLIVSIYTRITNNSFTELLIPAYSDLIIYKKCLGLGGKQSISTSP